MANEPLCQQMRDEHAEAVKVTHEMKSDEGWSLVKDAGGIKTYYRQVPGTPVHSVRMIADLDAPLLHVCFSQSLLSASLLTHHHPLVVAGDDRRGGSVQGVGALHGGVARGARQRLSENCLLEGRPTMALRCARCCTRLPLALLPPSLNRSPTSQCAYGYTVDRLAEEGSILIVMREPRASDPICLPAPQPVPSKCVRMTFHLGGLMLRPLGVRLSFGAFFFFFFCNSRVPTRRKHACT